MRHIAWESGEKANALDITDLAESPSSASAVGKLFKLFGYHTRSPVGSVVLGSTASIPVP